MVDGHETVTTNDLAESICRKLMVPEDEADPHYVDLDGGVIDSWINLTEDEKDYLRSLAGETRTAT